MDLDFNGHIESLDSEFLQLSEMSPLAVLAITPEQRKAALDLLLPYQRADFEGIFRAMDGLPVTIRLLDPPLHELLPEGDVEQIVNELTGDTGMTEEEVYSRIERMSEVNPCLDFAGASIVVIQASHIYVGSNHTTKSDLS